MKERDKYGNPKKFYILCAINPLTAYHQYYYLKDKKASTVAETLMENLFRTFGGITKISMDLGSENANLIQNQMSNIYKYSCRFSNKARARSNYAENSVRRLSRFLKLVTSSGNVHDIKRNLSIIGTLVNAAYLPNFNGKTSCHMIGGSNGDANLYAPSILIGKPHEEENLTFLEKPVDFLRKMVKVMRDEYNVYLTIKRGDIHTFESLGISEGDLVYYRTYSTAGPVVYGLASVLPKFQIGKVKNLISRSSAIIENLKTNRLLRRHISDIHRIYTGADWRFTSSYENQVEDYLREKKGLDLYGPKEVAEFNLRLRETADSEFNRDDDTFVQDTRDIKMNDEMKKNDATERVSNPKADAKANRAKAVGDILQHDREKKSKLKSKGEDDSSAMTNPGKNDDEAQKGEFIPRRSARLAEKIRTQEDEKSKISTLKSVIKSFEGSLGSEDCHVGKRRSDGGSCKSQRRSVKLPA